MDFDLLIWRGLESILMGGSIVSVEVDGRGGKDFGGGGRGGGGGAGGRKACGDNEDQFNELSARPPALIGSAAMAMDDAHELAG